MTDERILAEALINKPLFRRKDVARRYEKDVRTIDRWQHGLLKPTRYDERGPLWTLRDLIVFEILGLPVIQKSETADDSKQLTLIPDGK